MIELDIEQGNDIILGMVQLKGIARSETFKIASRKGKGWIKMISPFDVSYVLQLFGLSRFLKVQASGSCYCWLWLVYKPDWVQNSDTWDKFISLVEDQAKILCGYFFSHLSTQGSLFWSSFPVNVVLAASFDFWQYYWFLFLLFHLGYTRMPTKPHLGY